MLSEVMDRLIPAVDDLPAAGQMGLGPEVERMASEVPRYAEGLEVFLEALAMDPLSRATGGFRALSADDQDNAIRVIERNIPDHFSTFLEIVYLVYYSQPAVHRRIGWVGRPPQARGLRPAALRRIYPGDSQETEAVLAAGGRLNFDAFGLCRMRIRVPNI